MAQLFVVRHGQASFGAADYDQLSDLGWQQSRWLGEYFAQRDIQFDRVITGTLKRHRETLQGIAEGMGLIYLNANPNALEHAGLNEYDSSVMFKARAAAGKMTMFDEANLSADRRIYFRELREALYDWSEAKLHPPDYQTFAQFRRGVADGLAAATQDGAKCVLLVSSGGPISNMVGEVLQVPNRVTIDLNLQTRNASISQFAFSSKTLALMSFNTVPHLDLPQRIASITYS